MDVWIPTHNMEAFSCTDHATLHAQVLLFTLYSFMWGVCVLHAQWCCTLAVSLTCPVRLYVWSLSYTPCAICLREFGLQLHTLCYFMWGVCLTHPVLFYVGSVLHTLRYLIRCTHERTVAAVVKPQERDIGSNKSVGCVFSEKPVD